ERLLLQDLTVRFYNNRDLHETLESVLETVASAIPRGVSAVFDGRDGRLRPVGHRSSLPDSECEDLIRRGARMVQQCSETRSTVAGPDIPGEPCMAALPLYDEAVLLVSRGEPGRFTPEERGYLLAVAGTGGLALQSARRLQALQDALERHRQACAQLEVSVQRLAFLLEGARSMTAALASTTILERLCRLIQVTLPHEAGALLAFAGPERPPREHRCWPADFWVPSRRSGLLALASSVVEGRPILVEDRAAWPHPPLSPELRSFMVSPLMSDRGVEGIAYLGTREAFNTEQLDVLSILCCQAGVAVQNARLHEAVVSARHQVVQSSKLAAVGQLAAGVAHEVNTPLCAVLVGIEMARMSLEEPEQADEHLKVAESAGGRCRDIISKLLYYARDAAQTRTRADLNEIVRDTLQLLGRQLTGEGVVVLTDLSEGIPPVTVNCTEIQQVLSNLLTNARDAVLAQGALGRQVRVRTTGTEGVVRLLVADQGPGLDPEVAERVFEPFYTTKPVGRGTGLGLSVSREIATRHGGSLSLETHPGRGATFCLELPAGAA
ncbi:MAG: ATP-binding protein, partial [Candidatus Eremiobacterota bacterium]